MNQVNSFMLLWEIKLKLSLATVNSEGQKYR